jgi:hypothetical protein
MLTLNLSVQLLGSIDLSRLDLSCLFGFCLRAIYALLLGFYLAHSITNLAPRLHRPEFEHIVIRKGQLTLVSHFSILRTHETN